MTETARVIANQLKAALSTLNQCVVNCPDAEWDALHGDYPFSQVLFHTLFYTDFYLERSEVNFKEQEYHRENRTMFLDYEEMEDKLPVRLYTRAQIADYMAFCLRKTDMTLGEDSESTLAQDCGISFRKMSRLELYVYLIRHVQHHAAQLGLRVQQVTGQELEWIASGWKDPAIHGTTIS